MDGEPAPEIVDTAVVVDSVPAMFPGVVRLGEQLLASFSTVPDGWPGGEVGITRSSDGGRSWSAPTMVARPTGDIDACLNAVGMTALADGTVLLPYNAVRWTPGGGVAGRRISLHLLASRDAGRTWEPRAVDVDFYAPCVYGAMVEIDGTVLWPIWGQRRPDERWRSALLRSSDGGGHWTLGATIGYDPNARIASSYAQPQASGLDDQGRPQPDLTRDPQFRPHSPIDGFNETTIGVDHDGSLLAVLRQQGVGGDDTTLLYRSRSSDSGDSWSRPEPMGFTGMSPLLHRLGQRLLLATRRRHREGEGGTPGVEVRMSSSGGQWSAPVPLVDPHGTRYTAEYQCGYPAMTQLDAERVLVLFYGFTPAGRRYVAANVLRT
jgi:hypothetical protein